MELKSCVMEEETEEGHPVKDERDGDGKKAGGDDEKSFERDLVIEAILSLPWTAITQEKGW